MAIALDHTIVPARDKAAAAQFFADIMGLQVKPGQGHFTQVQVNEALTFDFADDEEVLESHHYAFHISDQEFDAILDRVQAHSLRYGSGPRDSENGQLNTRRNGRGFYFRNPDGHLLEVMTSRETASS